MSTGHESEMFVSRAVFSIDVFIINIVVECDASALGFILRKVISLLCDLGFSQCLLTDTTSFEILDHIMIERRSYIRFDTRFAVCLTHLS